jgi:hypothetical protein
VRQIHGEEVVEMTAVPILAQQVAMIVKEGDLAWVIQVIGAGHGDPE